MRKEPPDLDIDFEGTHIKRRFDKKWSEQGFIRDEAIPKLVESLVAQKKEMQSYIETLHDTIDYMMEHNKICPIPGCLTAGCTSSHK